MQFRGALCKPIFSPKLKDLLVLGHHEIFVGEIVNTYVQGTCLTDEKPDLEKIDPILFDMMKLDYWALGRPTGKPWRDGKALKKISGWLQTLAALSFKLLAGKKERTVIGPCSSASL